VAVPIAHSAAARRQQLYEAVHGSIVELLADFGIEASIQSAADASRPAAEPFLCFQRRSPGDVLVGQCKVAGSAQRRSHTAVLQHGSLLLARSPAAPELPGLTEVAGRSFALEQVVAGWLPRLSEQLGMSWVESAISLDERHRAAQVVAEKHATEAWIQRRGHPPGDSRPDIVPRSS
jgi:lipoate-protein ligase A